MARLNMRVIAVAMTLLWVPCAQAQTGSSAWSRVTTAKKAPAKSRSKTSGSKPAARQATARKTVPVRAAKPSEAARSGFRKSTLGQVFVKPAGENAAYIAFDQGQYLTALRIAENAAARGDAAAHTLIARIFAEGLGVPVDAYKAAVWYRRAAELGDIEAMFAFAVMLAAGRGIEKNRPGAADLFERAAKKGHAEAHYNLGLLFLTGDGKPENPRRAFLHIRFAAQRGLAAAQYDLAALYRRGHGTDPDAYEGARWLKTAAKSGMPAAQYDYAVALLQGAGLNADRPFVVDYLVDAARNGIAGAQNRLAHIYAEGQLVRKDMKEAAKWRFIARSGGLKAQKADTALDAQIAKLDQKVIRVAQSAADNFIDGARVGTFAGDASPSNGR